MLYENSNSRLFLGTFPLFAAHYGRKARPTGCIGGTRIFLSVEAIASAP